MADNLNYFSDDEESEWLANIDSSILDKPSEETQLHDSEISAFIEANRNSNTIPFRFAYFCHAFPVNKYPRNSPALTENLACWIINLSLDVLLRSIAENFYSLFVF